MHRRQGRDPVQRPGSRTDAAASGRQPGEDDCRPEPVRAGLGRVLRLQPVARVAIVGWLDPTAPALRRLGPVEDARSALSRALSAQGPRKVGQCGYLQPKGTVAAELLGSSASRLHQSSLPSSGPHLHGKADGCLIRRIAVVRTRMPGGVGGAASRDVPLSRLNRRSTRLTLQPSLRPLTFKTVAPSSTEVHHSALDIVQAMDRAEDRLAHPTIRADDWPYPRSVIAGTDAFVCRDPGGIARS